MDRKQFVKSMALLPIIGSSMTLQDLNKMTNSMSNTGKMPVLFLGHGSPMNAIEENEFVSTFRKLGQELIRPNAILCISAHWETNGTYVTTMQNPRTIHDFGGFPQALFDVQYPAPGSPELATETKHIISKTAVGLDDKWGLDHGAWSVIKHLYPKADIPVIQMSIDYTKSAKYHYELAKEINSLRNKGVLIIGSGNMVHNLRKVAWDRLNEEFAYSWTFEANEKMKSFILNGDHQSLIDFRSQGKAFDLAIPTPEHYMPLLYALALKEENETIELFNDKPVGGSLSMTSVKIG
ncbi:MULTISPECIES: 4,5-DOPA dioxygenase extradiol [Flavobacteriaceae]|jgi:4,5-DOPA dioxygenase extradiol|nr:4,5-DOPA dioxygenase extradiol [Arenibacter algicola]|tara:strand:+ start:10936 stop:11817 length:882 start_codon:yes stop_codon:yes gene_type:complete